jgi:predicted aspartyl protease
MLINLFVPPNVPENRPIINIKIKQDNYLFLIDTGFTINIISERLKLRLLELGQLTVSSSNPSTSLYGGSEVKILDVYLWKSESFENTMKTAVSDSFIPRLRKENASKILDGILGIEFINQFDNISLIFPNFIADLNTKKYPSDYRMFPFIKSIAAEKHLIIKSNYNTDLRAFVIENLPIIVDRRFSTTIRGIFDTGAEVTVLSYALYKKIGKPSFTGIGSEKEATINIGGSKVRGKYVKLKVPLLSQEKEFQVFIISSNDVNKDATMAMDDIEALIGMDIFMNLPKHETIEMKITKNGEEPKKMLEIFHKKN